MLIVGTIFLMLPPTVFALYVLLNYFVAGKRSVCIVVLGDIGRSPRMQYHAMSFLKCGFDVDIVGYGGSEIQADLKNNKNVDVHQLQEVPGIFKGFPKLLLYVIKVIWQSVTLGISLLLLPKSGNILIQNPPCIPTFLVVWIVCWLRGSKMVVDWHNYGYTIMGLSLGYRNPLVRLAKWYEHFFGKFSSENVCVTKAMQKDLQDNWGIRATVMYDRPAHIFKETPLNDRHKLFLRLAEEYSVFRPKSGTVCQDETAFTVSNGNGDAFYLQSRPALVISSTSWTEDEDFGVLLAALEEYEKQVSTKTTDIPDIVCVITGKGPLKEFYQKKIESQQWSHVSFCLPWLSPEDYPLLLGSADLGICLHKSSSGLDLPMKVVDMFGCCLPVCAIDFNCLGELVKHEENGLIFNDSQGLNKSIHMLLQGFPNNSKKLDQFRKNLTGFQTTRWHDCWVKTVLPIFEDQSSQTADNKKSQ
ncbi:chitobiosyldiphosphodolichol beta-mannosyltransferase-like [Mercenaria mercenaria]|uniref:chitobiosyldiphosphodolichol beta-mannosyltransferase-like n=1 Tax=Mercenaria mercenaria TaxID=6596 RepID=UPI00234F53E1|nr:chitobiosyldiphosphodolichol beta-mannosyltransferase-like [Mercenaria mercenaria]